MQLAKLDRSLFLPGVVPEMLSPEFWLERFPDFDLDHQWMGAVKDQPKLALSDYFANIAHRLRNLSNKNGLLPEKIIDNFIQWDRPEYGLMTQSGDLKLLPWESPLFLSNKEGPDLDRNQLSGLDIGDRVVVFGLSIDGQWYLTVTDAGTGWVKREMVGIGPEIQVRNFLSGRSRMVLLDPASRIQTKNSVIKASMGCSFPINDYSRRTVLIPHQNAKGNLEFIIGIIKDGAIRNHLPKTAYHLIRQAFKYLGHPYAWGDRDSEGCGRDCSRLIRDVLRTMGFNPPRNSQEQLIVGQKRINLAGLNNSQRITRLKRLAPGALLFTPEHVMIFLGEVQGEVYIIHALFKYLRPKNTGQEPVIVKRVAVSGLKLGMGTDGGSLLERLTEVVEV